jgi:hypothetical protein
MNLIENIKLVEHQIKMASPARSWSASGRKYWNSLCDKRDRLKHQAVREGINPNTLKEFGSPEEREYWEQHYPVGVVLFFHSDIAVGEAKDFFSLNGERVSPTDINWHGQFMSVTHEGKTYKSDEIRLGMNCLLPV